METISELLASILVLSIAIIFLTEFFYNIIRNKIRKKHHSQTPPTTSGDDKRKEGDKEEHSMGASCLLAFLLTIFSPFNSFHNQHYSHLIIERDVIKIWEMNKQK